jgi:hypothetical protein
MDVGCAEADQGQFGGSVKTETVRGPGRNRGQG